EENKSQDGRATADIFDKCLHHYLIKDAIRDYNVLGFSVEYNQTFNSHDDLDEEYISKINTSEIWMADECIEAVCRHLIANYHEKTDNRNYTSMFAVQSIPMAIK